jgi:hypothetical protein
MRVERDGVQARIAFDKESEHRKTAQRLFNQKVLAQELGCSESDICRFLNPRWRGKFPLDLAKRFAAATNLRTVNEILLPDFFVQDTLDCDSKEQLRERFRFEVRAWHAIKDADANWRQSAGLEIANKVADAGNYIEELAEILQQRSGTISGINRLCEKDIESLDDACHREICYHKESRKALRNHLLIGDMHQQVWRETLWRRYPNPGNPEQADRLIAILVGTYANDFLHHYAIAARLTSLRPGEEFATSMLLRSLELHVETLGKLPLSAQIDNPGALTKLAKLQGNVSNGSSTLVRSA